MKILHAVLSQGFYGSERYCAELAASQARDGHDVEIIVHGAWSDCAREMRKAVALANTVGAGTLRLIDNSRHGCPRFMHRRSWRVGVCDHFGPISSTRISIRPARRVGP